MTVPRCSTAQAGVIASLSLKASLLSKGAGQKSTSLHQEDARDIARKIAQSWHGGRRGDCAKRSRCCSRISNVFSSWTDFD
jgi:hypothetical protein